MLVLNIGLDKLPASRALATLATHGIRFTNAAVERSDTERTLIVDAECSPIEVYALADALGEDCIAAYDPETGKGYLEGPRAEAWGGEFIPEYFILQGGSRLAQPKAA